MHDEAGGACKVDLGDLRVEGRLLVGALDDGLKGLEQVSLKPEIKVFP